MRLIFRGIAVILLTIPSASWCDSGSKKDPVALVSLSGFDFPVLASAGFEKEAKARAKRIQRAFRYLNTLLPVRPKNTIYALSRKDWPEHAGPSAPSLPFYNQAKLFLPIEAAAMSEKFVTEITKYLPSEIEKLKAAYPLSFGKINIGAFYELIDIHELGHSYSSQAGFQFPRGWLSELFANLCLHTYIATQEPSQLPILTVFPEAYAKLPGSHFAHHSLFAFEQRYPDVPDLEYVWYQTKLHIAARKAYDEGGEAVLKRLWAKFGSTDLNLAEVLAESVSKEIGAIITEWPERK
jgi:hypothetical protein